MCAVNPLFISNPRFAHFACSFLSKRRAVMCNAFYSTPANPSFLWR